MLSLLSILTALCSKMIGRSINNTETYEMAHICLDPRILRFSLYIMGKHGS